MWNEEEENGQNDGLQIDDGDRQEEDAAAAPLCQALTEQQAGEQQAETSKDQAGGQQDWKPKRGEGDCAEHQSGDRQTRHESARVSGRLG